MTDELVPETPAEDTATPEAQVEPRRQAEPSGPDWWDRSADWLAVHGPLPALAVITVAILVIHAHIFTGETAGDDLSFHFAESARLVDCLRSFDFDMWNPSANAGYASAYYYQVLPQLASALPAALFGHHLFWFSLSVVLPLILAPACAYKGMRLLGATPWQAVVAAFVVGFMNGASRWGAGNAGTFQVGLYTQTWALCAFPLALGYGARWVAEGKQLASAIAWGAFVGFCHPFAGIVLGLAIIAAWFAQIVLLGVDAWLAALAPKLEGKAVWLDELAARWKTPPRRPLFGELWRGAVLAVAFAICWMPLLLPLLIDREGFGGFPHRVADEVGPGFKGLWKWYWSGEILDYRNPREGGRLNVLTIALPIAIVFARGKMFRWLWAPAFVFAVLLGLGPNIGKIGDDLFPPVRALGAMQTVMAMGIGTAAILIGTQLWRFAGKSTFAYSIRTGIAAAAAALLVLVAVPGSAALAARVRVLPDQWGSKPHELAIVNQVLASQPQGRKAVGSGAENHWWNLLSYAYHRVPATLQMGGGGLQASPNYDFLWSQRDHVKNAWIFDAPYLVFLSAGSAKMPLGQTLARTFNYEVRKLPTPGLVSPVQVTGTLPPGYRHDEVGHKKALEWIKGDGPMKDQVLAYAGSEGHDGKPAGRLIRAWRQDSPGDDADIVAEIEAHALTTFTIRESWHPRWHAYLNGEEIPVRRVTPDFPAVDVPPGKHTLELRFERPWWMLASWGAWPLLPLIAWLVLRGRGRKSAADLPVAKVVA